MTKLRLRVEAIEEERRRRGWSQVEFAQRAGFGVSRYRKVLADTRAGTFPNVGSDIQAGILAVLGWTAIADIIEVVIET